MLFALPYPGFRKNSCRRDARGHSMNLEFYPTIVYDSNKYSEMELKEVSLSKQASKEFTGISQIIKLSSKGTYIPFINTSDEDGYPNNGWVTYIRQSLISTCKRLDLRSLHDSKYGGVSDWGHIIEDPKRGSQESFHNSQMP